MRPTLATPSRMRNGTCPWPRELRNICRLPQTSRKTTSGRRSWSFEIWGSTTGRSTVWWETKRALEQFQENNGLDRTARLDGQTRVALFGNIGISPGSSMPPTTDQGSGSMTKRYGGPHGTEI